MPLFSCSSDTPGEDDETTTTSTTTTTVDDDTFAKGADISWVTQLESEGYTFKNSKGVVTDCFKLLKEDCNVNAIRLRVWVNPSDGWCGAADVVSKAIRANSLGQKVMINFHFSDTWADPSKQTPPTAWANYDIEEMKTAVATHVKDVLGKLKQAGVEPAWVQIGNETATGMLWDLGLIKAGSSNFADLVNAGYDAAKSVFADTKVIVHVDQGNVLSRFNYVFGYLKTYGGKYDMIGMSIYPDPTAWSADIDQLVSNINALYNTYGKPVMVCEIGMNYQKATECRDCISALITKGKATGHLEGVFYWEPEAPAGYNGGYAMGCFDNSTPTVALDAYK
jgi:arabinogalactan endo-1,4-beta-galactosidase